MWHICVTDIKHVCNRTVLMYLCTYSSLAQFTQCQRVQDDIQSCFLSQWGHIKLFLKQNILVWAFVTLQWPFNNQTFRWTLFQQASWRNIVHFDMWTVLDVEDWDTCSYWRCGQRESPRNHLGNEAKKGKVFHSDRCFCHKTISFVFRFRRKLHFATVISRGAFRWCNGYTCRQ